jgi:hypothetical protein
MLSSPADFLGRNDIRPTFLNRFQRLLHRMDEAYAKAAEHYGFHCDGCDDSCCRTRFYHHTHLEYLYLCTGFERLGAERRTEIRRIADRYCRALADAEKQNVALQRMCPLNFEGRCSLYAYRPMICRLHGIPHSLRLPGRGPVYGTGCEAFQRRCGQPSDIVFDRTPHYLQLAELESEFMRAFGLNRRIKMTVAAMILHFQE